MEDLLKRLGEIPPPAALGQIDEAIIAAWSAERREAASQARVLPAAALVALGLGLAGGSLSSASAEPSGPSELVAPTALAPSSLLDARR